jgi:hypothetical protein
MPETVLPRKPVENWEQVRDDWVNEVQRIIHEAEVWSQRRGWATLRDERNLTEDRIGPYRVPVLLIHTTKGRLLLTPEARYVVGANGLIDLNVYPSFDTLISLVKRDDGWRFQAHDSEEIGDSWSEESFVKTVNQLLESA